MFLSASALSVFDQHLLKENTIEHLSGAHFRRQVWLWVFPLLHGEARAQCGPAGHAGLGHDDVNHSLLTATTLQGGILVKNSQQPRLRSNFAHLLAVGHWTSYFTKLYLPCV